MNRQEILNALDEAVRQDFFDEKYVVELLYLLREYDGNKLVDGIIKNVSHKKVLDFLRKQLQVKPNTLVSLLAGLGLFLGGSAHAETYRAVENVNVRSAPSLSGKATRTLKAGSIISAEGLVQRDGIVWAPVKTSKGTEYVAVRSEGKIFMVPMQSAKEAQPKVSLQPVVKKAAVNPSPQIITKPSPLPMASIGIPQSTWNTPNISRPATQQVVDKNVLFNQVISTIMQNEGWREYSYDDRGHRSIGYGINLTAMTDEAKNILNANGYDGTKIQELINGKGKLTAKQIQLGVGKLSKEIASQILKADIAACYNHLKREHPQFDSYPINVQVVLIDMRYNMGPSFITTWPNFHRHIRNKNVAGAIVSIQKSDYKNQVKERAKRNIALLTAAQKKYELEQYAARLTQQVKLNQIVSR